MSYTREQMRSYMAAFRKRRREEAVQKLGGKCAECQRTDSLHFDHIDPATKIAPMGKLLHASEAVWQAELAKCQLLCVECHKKKHRASSHGIRGWRRGCRCDVCCAARREATRKIVEHKRRVRAQQASPLLSKRSDLTSLGSSTLSPSAKDTLL